MYWRPSRRPDGNGLTLPWRLRTPCFAIYRRSCRQEKAWFGRWRRRQGGSMTVFGIRGRTGTSKDRKWTPWGSNPSLLARGGKGWVPQDCLSARLLLFLFVYGYPFPDAGLAALCSL